MTDLPNPFLTESAAIPFPAEPEAPAATQPRRAGADLLGCPIDDVGEIFHWPAKLLLEPQPPRFDPAAYNEFDEILYQTLLKNDRPATRDLSYIPDVYAFRAAIEDVPLFLRARALPSQERQ